MCYTNGVLAAGCATPVVQTTMIDSNAAVQAAITRAKELDWEGPFQTLVTQETVPLKGELWMVSITREGGVGKKRSALVYVSGTGEIIEFK